MRIRSTMPLALGVLIAACAPEAEQAPETAEATTQEFESPAAAIATLAANYEEQYNLGNAAAVADMYTQDAIVQTTTSEVVVGRAAIAASIEQFMAALSPQLTINPIEQVMVGDWVLDRGTYANEVEPEGGEPITLTGNYMSLSRRTPDGLKLHRLAVNFDGPPPIPLPAPEPFVFEPVSDALTAELLASYAKHLNLGHASMVAAMWAEDGVSMIAEQPAVMGRANIEARLTGLVAERAPTLTISSAETIDLGDGIAVGRGSFTTDATIDGQAVSRTGTYMTVTEPAADGSRKIMWALTSLAPMASM